MALTDPELDLLLELVSEDPAAEVFVQVGQELARRERWAEGMGVLSRGLEHHPELMVAWPVLARTALEAGRPALALDSIRRTPIDPTESLEPAIVEMLALERLGRVDEAMDKAVAFLEIWPNEVVVSALIERIEAPPPDPAARAADPFVTVARAERYVAIDRVDRAVRLYRRILFHNRGDRALETRLARLASGVDEDHMADDLSEEIVSPDDVLPDLTMPLPTLHSADFDNESTEIRDGDRLNRMLSEAGAG